MASAREEMQARVEVSTVEWERTVVRFAAEMQKGAGDVLRSAMKGVLRDVVKLTPPFRSLSAKESWAEQRRIGEKAVSSGIQRVFAPVEALKISADDGSRVRQAVREAARQRDFPTINVILERCGYMAGGIERAQPLDPEFVESQRNRRGKVVRNPKRRFALIRELRLFIRRKQANVGILKAGWAAAASRLGIILPAWIVRHGNQGRIEDRTADRNNPWIQATNTVPWADAENRDLRFVEIALRNARGRMERQLEAKARGAWR